MLNDIESNLWEPTKQTPIIVSKSAGCIADGHHRLITVLMLGRTLDCEVIHVD
jgi:ParB-like chromosome segregation protein Spo0J